MPVRRLWSIAVLTTLCAVAASCSSSSSPATPSHSALGSGATIVGHVNGFSSSTNSQRHLDGSSSTAATGLSFTENASTTLTVSINGTNITSNVDGNGNFELTGVPPGDVTLKFSGAGVSASITLTGVPASSQISSTVTLNGNSARLEDRNDDNDEDEKDDGDLEGVVSNKSGTCPSLTFTVQGATVNTDGTTKFEGIQCAQIANGTKVEVEGTRQANDNVLAKKVESD